MKTLLHRAARLTNDRRSRGADARCRRDAATTDSRQDAQACPCWL